MEIDWLKVKEFVHRRTLFCTAAVLENGAIRLFPIGSLRLRADSLEGASFILQLCDCTERSVYVVRPLGMRWRISRGA